MRLYTIPAGEQGQTNPLEAIPPSGAVLARFHEMRGYRVVEAGGAFWSRLGPSPFSCTLADPLLIDAAQHETDAIMRQTGIRLLRYATANDSGIASGLYYVIPREYDLKRLAHRQTRSNIARGMEECQVRRIEARDLLREGLPLNLDTMERQGRYDPEFGEPARWKRFVEALDRCPELEVAGAYAGGVLAAYQVACREGGWYQMVYGMSRTATMVHRPNHAIDYWAILEAASDPGIRFVSNGYVHIVSDGNLDQFKRRMGFQLAPLNLAFRIHPAIAPLLTNRLSVAAARRIGALRPRDQRMQFRVLVLEYARSAKTAVGGQA